MTTLNGTGRANAHSLIAAGKVDKNSSWSFSADDGNALLGPSRDDWANYGKFHLGADTSVPNDTRGHWNYPFGKGGKVYRSGLVAIRQRASQQNETEIYDAAGTLIDEIDGEKEDSASNEQVRARVKNFFAGAPAEDRKWYSLVRNEANPDEADLLLYDEIGGWSGTTAQQFMTDLKACDAKTINLRINSPGGSVFDGLAIYNALANHSAKIVTHVDGWAASIASVIAMAGDQINIAENAQIMIHKPWSFAMGSADDMRKEADVLDGIQASIAGIYAARTGNKIPALNDMMNAETWMKGKEAVDAGFADVCVPNKEPPKPAAKLPTEFFASLFALPQDMRAALSKRTPPARDSSTINLETATDREIERHLRDSGFSRAQSTQISNGLKALALRDSGELRSEPTDPALRDSGGEQAESVLKALRRLAAKI